jgi:phospholipid/cholesterol/gamma-HCH transport system ATP-binding protein
VAEGRVVGEGTPAQIRATELPVVHQFVHGEIDGPVPFHYPAPSYDEDVGLGSPRAEPAHA